METKNKPTDTNVNANTQQPATITAVYQLYIKSMEVHELLPDTKKVIEAYAERVTKSRDRGFNENAIRSMANDLTLKIKRFIEQLIAKNERVTMDELKIQIIEAAHDAEEETRRYWYPIPRDTPLGVRLGAENFPGW